MDRKLKKSHRDRENDKMDSYVQMLNVKTLDVKFKHTLAGRNERIFGKAMEAMRKLYRQIGLYTADIRYDGEILMAGGDGPKNMYLAYQLFNKTLDRFLRFIDHKQEKAVKNLIESMQKKLKPLLEPSPGELWSYNPKGYLERLLILIPEVLDKIKTVIQMENLERTYVFSMVDILEAINFLDERKYPKRQWGLSSETAHVNPKVDYNTMEVMERGILYLKDLGFTDEQFEKSKELRFKNALRSIDTLVQHMQDYTLMGIKDKMTSTTYAIEVAVRGMEHVAERLLRMRISLQKEEELVEDRSKEAYDLLEIEGRCEVMVDMSRPPYDPREELIYIHKLSLTVSRYLHQFLDEPRPELTIPQTIYLCDTIRLFEEVYQNALQIESWGLEVEGLSIVELNKAFIHLMNNIHWKGVEEEYERG